MEAYNKEILYESAAPAKKIGREVHFVKGRNGNPRSGEAAHLRLKNGDILCAYSDFYDGEDWADMAASRISGFLSHDEGETWSDSFVMFDLPEGYSGLMCVSLLRLADGDVAVLYGAYLTGNRAFQLFFRRSDDEAKTWSDAIPVLSETALRAARHCLENDRLIQLSSGRLLTACSLLPADAIGKSDCTGIVSYYSDDGGYTWHSSEKEIWLPFSSRYGLQEPGVILMPDGRIRMWARTNLGCQYECFSSDEGETWTDPIPMEFFKSPLSPMLMKHVGDLTVAVYNPEPFHLVNRKPKIYLEKGVGLFFDRTPLALSVSDDGGVTYPRTYLLEEDPFSIYCYPAVFDGGDYILVSYYHSNHTENFFHSYKTVKIRKDELK